MTSKRVRPVVPHPRGGDPLALVELPSEWRDLVCWVVRRLESGRHLGVRAMARECRVHHRTAEALLRSDWPAWARHVLGLSAVEVATDDCDGHTVETGDLPIQRRVAALRAARMDTPRTQPLAVATATKRRP